MCGYASRGTPGSRSSAHHHASQSVATLARDTAFGLFFRAPTTWLPLFCSFIFMRMVSHAWVKWEYHKHRFTAVFWLALKEYFFSVMQGCVTGTGIRCLFLCLLEAHCGWISLCDHIYVLLLFLLCLVKFWRFINNFLSFQSGKTVIRIVTLR